MKLPKASIQKMLYATDLTKGATGVFAYAVHLADTLNASIKILQAPYDNLNVESFAAFQREPGGPTLWAWKHWTIC